MPDYDVIAQDAYRLWQAAGQPQTLPGDISTTHGTFGFIAETDDGTFCDISLYDHPLNDVEDIAVTAHEATIPL